MCGRTVCVFRGTHMHPARVCDLHLIRIRSIRNLPEDTIASGSYRYCCMYFSFIFFSSTIFNNIQIQKRCFDVFIYSRVTNLAKMIKFVHIPTQYKNFRMASGDRSKIVRFYHLSEPSALYRHRQCVVVCVCCCLSVSFSGRNYHVHTQPKGPSMASGRCRYGSSEVFTLTPSVPHHKQYLSILLDLLLFFWCFDADVVANFCLSLSLSLCALRQ